MHTSQESAAIPFPASSSAAQTVPRTLSTRPVDGEAGYAPNRTLGRSGYVPAPADELSDKIRHLDALLCFVSLAVAADCASDDPVNEFQSLNNSIQVAVLELASCLATQVHELHEQVCREKADKA